MNSNALKPNVLFVFSDQHRWCDLNSYGNTQIISPNFDAFAEKALQFENCIANCPLCVPSRGTLLTGLFPLKHGAAANDLPMNEEVQSFGEVLKMNRYHTGYIGKWHLAGVPRDQAIPPGLKRYGFDEWKVANCTHDYMNSYYDDEQNNRHKIIGYEPIKQTDLAIDFIERNHQQVPWALVLSWGPPHDPYDAVPQRYLDLYEAMPIKLRDNVGKFVNHSNSEGWSNQNLIDCHRGYYAHISALDEQFGRLLDALKRTGQLENTIVVYTSDHGNMLGSQGMFNKQSPWEESIKVPLMISWENHVLQGRRNELISLVDLPVSLLGLIGLTFREQVDGKDLHDLFINWGAKGLDSCYIFELSACHQASNQGLTEWRGIRTERYTFARSVNDDGWLLYDNLNDPFQLDNLAHQLEWEEVKTQLSDQLNQYIARHDGLKSWGELIDDYGFRDKWNVSENYFKFPTLFNE
jgi:arylsulfatase A-like enzyme